nr:hypothetical protein [Candidatus Eremiobacteraeota bacterium]
RLDGRRKRVHAIAWRDVPAGAFVDVDGAPHVVLADGLRLWSAASGYGELCTRPVRGDATVLTPPASLAVLRAGYDVQIGPPAISPPDLR